MKMSNSTYRMTLTALFIALIVLLGLTPVGLIHLGFINVTVLCVPVIIGTILLGLKSGLLLGFCFGLVSLLSALGVSMVPPSTLAANLIGANMFYAIVMCFLPRLAVPTVTYGVYRLIAKKTEKCSKALPFSAAAGSLTNTILYLGLMLLFYKLCGLDTTTIIGLITGTGLIAGSCEAVVAAVLATPIMVALWKIKK